MGAVLRLSMTPRNDRGTARVCPILFALRSCVRDCGLGDIVRVHRDLFVRPHQVYRREHCFPGQTLCEVLDVGHGIFVRDRSRVQRPIIAARSPLVALLWDQVQGR